MSAGTRHYGAKWWKFDFHTHTPKSDDYGKGPQQDILKARSPREWLLDVMNAGLDCVAITDHNSGEWIDALKQELASLNTEKPEGYRPITLFPGVEISVHGGIHILALFAPSASGSTIISLLSKCRFEGQYGKTDDCTRKSFSEVVELIQEEGGIPILAHADADSGLFKKQSGVTLKQSLRADGLLAMELIASAETLPGAYSELKLSLASVIGSDSHHPPKVGTRYTWVKMESPSLEALRLALHDGEDGVRRMDAPPSDPNDIGPRFYLRRLTVSKGQKIGNGHDLTLELSPWLTTLIGGRGSGKSSILDFLRIVLAKTDDMPPEVKNEFEKFNRIPRGRGELGMLRPETTVRLELVKDGRDIALIWSADGTWSQEECDSAGHWMPAADVGDVQKRFPLRIFSQKQLYEMTKEPDVLLNLIDQRWDKRAWLERRQFLTEKWLQNRRDVRQKEKEIATVAQTRAELEDVKAKIRIFEDSGNREVLSKYQSVRTTKQALDAKAVALQTAASTLAGAQRQLSQIELEEDLQTAIGSESSQALQAVLGEYEALRSRLISIQSELEALSDKWVSTFDAVPWKAELEAASTKYEELKSQIQQGGGVDISEYSTLVTQRSDLEGKVKKLSEYETSVAKLREAGAKLLQEAADHDRVLRAERKLVIASWTQSTTGERLRVTLQDMGNRESSEEQLRQLIRKPGEEFSADIYRSVDGGEAIGMLAKLIEQTNARDCWTQLDSIRKTLCEATVSDPKGLDRRFARHLEQLRLNTPEDLDRIAIWTPEDRLKLELVKADGSVENIETGSAGQRTAGLLGLVLSLDDSPVIIDQPEDDLETRLISSLVVSGLRQLKKDQQVIVVTHNPNIPVNGAAEQIVEMCFSTGQICIGAMGALQRQEIRRAVCEVMEGGKDALDKRYYRISRALS
ncbi:MAG: TrlF family AAA-like ATPase [Kiritimatiellia bacterium]